MKTVQMTLDESLVTAVDGSKTTWHDASAFARTHCDAPSKSSRRRNWNSSTATAIEASRSARRSFQRGR